MTNRAQDATAWIDQVAYVVGGEITTPVSEMERDAARYRWLRERTEYRSLAHNKWLRLPDFQLRDGPREGWARDHLDAAIDAAMRATGAEA